MNEKNKQKKLITIAKHDTKGITVLALAITIIVLLILAGITIGMLTSEDGIIKKAQDAKKVTDIAEIEEEVRVLWFQLLQESMRDHLTPTELAERFQNKLRKRDDKATVNYREEDKIYEVYYKGHNMELEDDGITGQGGGQGGGNEGDINKPISSSDITVTLEYTSMTYTGSALTPGVTVKDRTNNKILTVNTDYTVNYANNINVGTATVTVTGKGNYSGSKTLTFTIGSKAMTINSEDYAGTYDGNEKTITLNVTKPTGTTIYYSTTTALTSSNYTSGSTTKPTRTDAGITTVYWYIKSNNANFADRTGSNKIIIDKVTATVSVTIKGNNTEGETLTAEVVTVSNGTKTYQWWYADSSTATTGTSITGATENTYTIASEYVGKYIGCTVTVVAGTNYNACSGSDITDATNNTTDSVEAANKIMVGDKVNYNPLVVGTYELSKTYSGYTKDQIIQRGTSNWKVLNINDNGTIDIINKTGTSAFYLNGPLGYNNGVYLLNDMCSKMYGDSSKGITARNININDLIDKMDLSVWNYTSYVPSGSQSHYTGYGELANATGNQLYYPYQFKFDKRNNTWLL